MVVMMMVMKRLKVINRSRFLSLTSIDAKLKMKEAFDDEYDGDAKEKTEGKPEEHDEEAYFNELKASIDEQKKKNIDVRPKTFSSIQTQSSLSSCRLRSLPFHENSAHSLFLGIRTLVVGRTNPVTRSSSRSIHTYRNRGDALRIH